MVFEGRAMTKAELLRVIAAACGATTGPRREGRRCLPARSPAAGGGISTVPPVPADRLRHATLRDPQTGNRVTLRRLRTRRTRG
jgi:hypothetical protein